MTSTPETKGDTNMTSTTENSDFTHKPTGYYPWWLDNLADDATGKARQCKASCTVGRRSGNS
jgi:hypothetical protein